MGYRLRNRALVTGYNPDLTLSRHPARATARRLPPSVENFLMAYDANRRRAFEDVVEADPVAACVRSIMAKQTRWVGTASDLLEATAGGGHQLAGRIADWPKNPRALAGRLRLSQAFLRTLGIEIAFNREGREGNRRIRMTSRVDFSPSAPSAPSATAEPMSKAQ